MVLRHERVRRRSDERGRPVQRARLKRVGLVVHGDVAQDAAAHGGDGAQDDGRHHVEPGREPLAHADDGPQRHRQVVEQVHHRIEVGGQLAEVEHHHARHRACEDERGPLERVDAVVLQKEVAHDAAGQPGDDGDAHHPEDVVARPHGAHGARQAAGQRSGHLQPEGHGEDDVEHANRLRRARARRPRRPRARPPRAAPRSRGRA